MERDVLAVRNKTFEKKSSPNCFKWSHWENWESESMADIGFGLNKSEIIAIIQNYLVEKRQKNNELKTGENKLK